METTCRIIAKAASWQTVGLIAMTAITYLVTGSVSEGGLIAAVGCACGMAMYVLHERVWANIAWGRQRDGEVSNGSAELKG